MYQFLCGHPPFPGNNPQQILLNVSTADIRFKEDEFSDVSEEAKDLISRLLVKDPNKRISLADALAHNWFDETEDKKELEINVDVVSRLINFKEECLMKRTMMTTMANLMGHKHIINGRMHDKFCALDRDNKG